MAGRASVRAARRWYAWEAVKLAAHFTWKRFGRREGGMGMERMIRNLRTAWRRLVRAPAFTAVAVATIALGVGANVAIFSVVDAVLLEPLPYEDPDELLALFEWHLTSDNRTNVANPRNYRLWRERAERFEGISAVSLQFPGTVEVGGEPQETIVQYAQPDFFDVLGLEAALGRTYGAGAIDDGHEVVLAHGYWRDRFGGDPGVVGTTLRLNGVPAVVVGVLPPVYMPFGEGTSLWRTLDMTVGDLGRWVNPIGRVADGVDRTVAQDEIRGIMAGLKDEFPEFNAAWDVNPVPLETHVVGDVRQGLWILLGSVGLLLLIACANVANLFLVAATERQREMAVRTSLGASGRNLAGQLLTESVLVAALGAALGVGLAYLGTTTLAGRMPDAFALPRVESAGVDGTVLLFAVALTVGTGLLFGLVPALQAARTAPAATLASEGRSTSRKTGLLRNGLVVLQVSLSLALLAGAALFARSFSALLDVDSGIDTEQVIAARVNLEALGARGTGAQTRFFEEYVGRLEALPDVASVGAVTFLPMDGLGSATGYYPSDRPEPSSDEMPTASIRNVVGDYFETMGIALLQGRTFDVRDRPDVPQVVVVNRALADRWWPDGSAVGRSVVVDWVDDTPWAIVGVVENVRHEGLDQDAPETIYMNYAQAEFFPWIHVAVRTVGPAPGLGNSMRRELAEMNASVPLGALRAMDDVVARTAARPRMTSFLMLLFAGLATVLAAVGLYGVLSYTVSQRVREIGVRVALGARPGDVSRMVAGRGLGMVALGLVLGLGLALVAGRLVSALLFGVEATDPLSLGAATAVLAAVAVAASVLPAVRAARMPPADALRAE